MRYSVAQKGSKRMLNAWAFYDWANSVYSLVISSAVFPIFYGALFRLYEVESVVVFGLELERGPLISYLSSAAFVVIAIATPLVSGIADYLGNKKFFLQFFCYLGALCCIGLYWFSLDHIYLSLLFYFGGLVGSWMSIAIYNSYLPDIAFKEQQDRVSARGFSLGYIGSVLLLVFNLAMVLKPNIFGIESTDSQPAEMIAMRYSFISVGLWWIVFSQYTFLYMPIGNRKQGSRKEVFLGGFNELKKVGREIKKLNFLKRYLVAFFIYSMAVQTILLIAAYFGEQEIDWGGDSERTIGLIVSILLIQLIAIVGSVITGRLAERFNNISLLMIINVVWLLLCIYAYFVNSPMQFFIAAGFVGLVMGSIQTLSRSTYSQNLPDTDDTTSYFSFYEVAEKIGIVIGTFIFGYIAQLTGSMRSAALFLGIFFLVGALLLSRLRKSIPRA
ncbi:MAG: MFS transporter [Bacteroidetes bacterium]|nr:MFS transporter [Bacteroidota bacterium]